MRRIDLLCAILAPVAVGLIMTYASNVAGIIFICGWNVLSFFAEYHLLHRVYRSVPRLAVKHLETEDSEAKKGSVESMYATDEFSKIMTEDDNEVVVEERRNNNCYSLFVEKLKSFYKGWAIYFNQRVALAGTSLACIYLTVLGFSSVTTGYAYTQRLSGAVVSVCFGIGSLMGIIGTFLFPRVRKRVGLVRTGVVSFILQWSMLIFCVVSIWTPGSPSDLYPKHNHLWQKHGKELHVINTTDIPSSRMPSTSLVLGLKPNGNPSSIFSTGVASTAVSSTKIPAKNTDPVIKQEKFSYISISLLMTGLLLSRIGLWMTDLTVTQLLQENVAERHRGIVSGTQSSFNAILDMLHYVLTIVLPYPNQFGILTLISFAAISAGLFFYILFYVRKSGDMLVRERGIGSVSSIEWNRENHDHSESKGFALIDDDDEEIVRGTLTLQEHEYDSKEVL